MFYDDEEIVLNIADKKQSIKLSDIFKALADAKKSGEFWLDEVDDYAYSLQGRIESLKNELEVIKEAIR